jgi:hypothetical protein
MQSELANVDFSLRDYDRIVLCQPLWAFHPVPAVNAFFPRSDLHGKRFHLVVTKGGSAGARLIERQKDCLVSCGAIVVSSLEVRGGMGKSKWVERKMLESLDAWVGMLPRKD